MTANREWKRLFPIRYRHLAGESSFDRWDWVTFNFGRPTSDPRKESCHVHEESIKIDGKLRLKERATLLNQIVVGSGKEAAERGHSLALIRPWNTRFIAKRRSAAEVEHQKEAFKRAAQQTSLFDEELAELNPSPYDFRFTFEDGAGKHDYQNGDWETHAMYWRGVQSTTESETLQWMNGVFNDEYPKKGMAFAIGNQAKRPQTWQLLGVIRLDELRQGELPF